MPGQVAAMTEPTQFLLFGSAHLTVLAVTLLAGLGISRARPATGISAIAWLIGLLLLGLALLKPVLYVAIYDNPWNRSLPLDLCRINELLCVYMLLRRSYRTFEIAYFLSMAGSLSALLMPDLKQGFPDPRFVTFFLSHALAVLAALYAVFGYGFRPTLRSLGLIVLFLGVYTLLIANVNLLLDANYLFLRSKPEGASVLDYLGPWPYYVIGLIGIAVVACILCYLPFAVRSASRTAG